MELQQPTITGEDFFLASATPNLRFMFILGLDVARGVMIHSAHQMRRHAILG